LIHVNRKCGKEFVVVLASRQIAPALAIVDSRARHSLQYLVANGVFAYLCAGTIGERVAELLAEKRALVADLVDGVPVTALPRLYLDSLMQAAAPRA
jgi:hypothetical protein